MAVLFSNGGWGVALAAVTGAARGVRGSAARCVLSPGLLTLSSLRTGLLGGGAVGRRWNSGGAAGQIESATANAPQNARAKSDGDKWSPALATPVPVPNSMWSRHRSSLFFGAQAGDDDLLKAWEATRTVQRGTAAERTLNIFELRAQAEAAVNAKDAGAFVRIAHDTLLWMEEGDERNPFYWPRKFGFWQEPAPAAKALELALRNVFGRVAGEPHNGAGLAIAGMRGLGKTHLLRAVVLVSGMLLPSRLVSVYVDYKSVLDPHAPGALLLAALRVAPPAPVLGRPVPSVLQQQLAATLAGPPSMAAAIGAAGLQKRAIVFAADEVSHVYLNTTVWSNLHALASDTSSCTLVADSGSKLGAMIKRSDVDTLRLHFGVSNNRDLPQSLNDDKLKLHQLRPLSTIQQYRAYLKQRSATVFTQLTAADEEDVIRGVHLHTGGRMRAMDNALEQRQATNLPDHDSAAYFVLDKLTRLQQHKPFDAFDTVAVLPQDVDLWLQQWHKKRNQHKEASAVDLYTLQDDNILVEHARKPGHYTFATPADYFRMLKVRPRVFLSHACTDHDDPMYVKLRESLALHGAEVVVCNSEGAPHGMASHGIPTWELLQLGSDSPNTSVILVLSEAFMGRLGTDNSGVRREVGHTRALAKAMQAKLNTPSLILVSLSAFQAKWLQHEQLDHVKTKLVYSLQTDMTAAVMHACNMRVAPHLQADAGGTEDD